MQELAHFLQACGIAIGVLLVLWLVLETRAGGWIAVILGGLLLLAGLLLAATGLI